MINKDIIMQRIFDNEESTISYMVYDDKNLTYNIEDAFRVNKVAGVTRIPSGRYKLELRVEMSGMTKRYKAKYDWFKWHIWITGVPNFNYVYMHIGNDANDTDGCILVGKSPNNNSITKGFVGSSTDTFKKFYQWILPKLQEGEDIYIQIRDELHREDVIKNQFKLDI